MNTESGSKEMTLTVEEYIQSEKEEESEGVAGFTCDWEGYFKKGKSVSKTMSL